LNARYLADAGAAVLIPDSELTYERLRREVQALLEDKPLLEAMSRAALGLARPHAAAVIASEILSAAGVNSGVVEPRRTAGELEA
jgi:UDP-N-acetylglucosamine--N-acetylmuramyl-(pentapeptide) pyrophosphoryl-undecaprenol N-acetylglucosamine transferase